MDEYTKDTMNSLRGDINTFTALLCRARSYLEAEAETSGFNEDSAEDGAELLADIEDALEDWE